MLAGTAKLREAVVDGMLMTDWQKELCSSINGSPSLSMDVHV